MLVRLQCRRAIFRSVVSRWGWSREEEWGVGGVLVVMIKLRRENKSSDPFRVITAKPCLPDGKFHLIKVGSLSDPSAVRPHVAPPQPLD